MQDHVHLLVSIPFKLSVAQFIGYLKYRFGKRCFWAKGNYASTVRLNEFTIWKYIRNQEKHDQVVYEIDHSRIFSLF